MIWEAVISLHNLCYSFLVVTCLPYTCFELSWTPSHASWVCQSPVPEDIVNLDCNGTARKKETNAAHTLSAQTQALLSHQTSWREHRSGDKQRQQRNKASVGCFWARGNAQWRRSHACETGPGERIGPKGIQAADEQPGGLSSRIVNWKGGTRGGTTSYFKQLLSLLPGRYSTNNKWALYQPNTRLQAVAGKCVRGNLLLNE